MKNKKQLAIAIIVWIFCITIFSYNMKKTGISTIDYKTGGRPSIKYGFGQK